MSKVLIIGAGGVGTVVAHKVAQHPEVFSEIMIASRTQSKCDAIVKAIGNPNIKTAKVDADNVDELVSLFNSFKPEIVINVALPYQDLTIMEACLQAGVNYLDTANYEPKDEAHFEYSWQWAYKKRFEDAGLTAILGCGFDPGVSGVYTAYAAKHHFDEIHYLDIVDCNAGNHHKAFATNFNPEINIREITQNGRYYKNGQWVTTQPLEFHKDLTYPNIGPRDSYLLYHEELESLVKNFPTIKRARFWMTFGHFCVCKAVLLLLDGFSLLPQKRKKPPRVPDSTFGHPGGLSLTYVIGLFGGALRLLCVLTTLFLRGLLLCGFLLSLFQGRLDQTQDELPLGHLAATAGALALQVLLDPLEQFLRDLEGHRPAAIVRIVVLPPFSFIL